jgi:hypothetical protein
MIGTMIAFGQNLLNATEQQYILGQFNAIRASVVPAAINMLTLQWDAGLEAISLSWAEQCQPGPDQKLKAIQGQLTFTTPAGFQITPDEVRGHFELFSFE